MISDMPLPMPFWVMSSPIHINNAVPAVSVRTTSATRGAVKLGNRSSDVPSPPPPCPPKPPPPLWNKKANAVDCSRAIPMVM